MRLRKRYLLAAAVVFGLVAMVLPTVASSVPSPVTAVDVGIYSHYWSNPQQTIMAGDTVKFSNPYSATEPPNHGLKFTGGSAGESPSCPGIAAVEGPNGSSNWKIECTFSKPGTYTFICTVHPLEMTGTITVTNGEPAVITELAAPVSEHEATLRGTVNPNGKGTEYFFKWGATEAYGEKTNLTSAGAGLEGVPASSVLSGLAPATTYHFKLVAKNEKGTVEGSDQTFTTASPPGPPVATTTSAVAIGETGAILKGTVNPGGQGTRYFFEWGTVGYGNTTSELSAGEDRFAHAESATLTGLAPATLYHFRIVAKNAAGPSSGADEEFTTASPPSSTSILPPAPVPPLTQLLPAKPEAPLSSPPLVAGSLKLTSSGHSSLHGSLELGQAGSGGSLEVDLLAKGSLLGKTRGSGSKSVRVGRLVRRSLSPGKLSFSLTLTAQGKRALARRHSLPLTVRITFTPARGTPVRVTRSVVLRA